MATSGQIDTVRAAVEDAARLNAVRATGLLDTDTEEAFDRLTRLAAKLTGAPVAFTSLVDAGRDFYKSCYGFPEPLATRRELTGTTFCHYAVAQRAPLVIEDTLESPVYRIVPTVASLGVRAYLGIPLMTAAGDVLGSFCAIDFQPRKWRTVDVEVMTELAASTLREIELRSTLKVLSDERRRLDVLLQQIPSGVVFADAATGQVVLRNRRAEEIIGVSPDGAWTGFRDDGAPVGDQEWPLRRALRGEFVPNEVILYRRPDGAQVWIRASAAPVRDADGSVIGGVAAFYDITQERAMLTDNQQLYEAAQAANRAKDEFFAAVTHELRTPMTAIIGWSRLLRTEVNGNADTMEALDAITSSAALQAQLVDDLLDVSRITTGKLTLHREPLPLRDVLEEAVRTALPAAESKGVSVRAGFDDMNAVVTADRARLKQIIGNLMSNAMKFTPAGGMIEVRARQSEGSAFIEVRDTGRGIDAALLPHIFERYRQSANGEMGGLGLGLTIVRHLVELHGGEITAASDGPGKGAAFTVRLPA